MLLISLKAGGVALNLTHANHIFLSTYSYRLDDTHRSVQIDYGLILHITTCNPPTDPFPSIQISTIVDPWWSPAAEMQAIDRTHRIGQYKPIFATRFIIEVRPS